VHRLLLPIAALAVVAAAPSGGAQVPAEAYLDAGDYVARVWTQHDGLPQNSANALARTPDGFLWIGTDAGLARFDGVRFEVFGRGSTGGGLPGTHITQLHVDRAGTLWVGTFGNGLARYAEGAFSVVAGLEGQPITALADDAEGTLWVGTPEGGRRLGADGTLGRLPVPELSEDFVTALLEDRQGLLWVGTPGALTALDGGRVVRRLRVGEGLPGSVGSLAQDAAGRLWIGTSAGVGVLDGEGLRWYTRREGLAGDFVYAVYAAGADVWVGSDGYAACRVRGEGLACFPVGGGGQSARAISFLADDEGGLWVGTLGYGLLRFAERAVRYVSVRDGLARSLVRPILEDRAGVVWIGTTGGFLHALDGEGLRVYGPEHGLPGSSVYALAEGPDGTLWVGTYGGGLLRRAGERFLPIPLPERAAHILALFADREGRLWIGTEGGGAFVRAGEAVGPVRGLPHATVRALDQTSDGAVWVGTDGGLAALRNGLIEVYTEGEDLPDGLILSLSPDPAADALWVATGGGLVRYAEGGFRTVPASAGLCGSPALLVDDGRGALWSHCARGVFRVEKRALHAVLDGRAEALAAPVLGREAGFEGEGNAGFQPGGWRGADGRVWLPTTHGAAVVDPARVGVQPPPPPVVIAAVAVDEAEPTPPTAALDLPPGRRRLAIHYTAPAFAAPEHVRFRYRLDGFDAGWVEAGARRTAYYTGLPPGRYRFRVAASHGDGVWGEEEASLSITLRPFFYETRVFHVLGGLACVALGLGLYRVRVRQLEGQEEALRALVAARTRELEAETERSEAARAEAEAAHAQVAAQAERLRALDEAKTRFFVNVSHEFRTPLTLVLGPLEEALAAGGLEARHRAGLETAHTQARALLGLVEQLLALARLDAGRTALEARRQPLRPLLEDLTRAHAPLAERQEVQLSVHVEPPGLEARFDAEKLEHVVSNLLSNALRFTEPRGRVAVSARALTGGSEVVVRDTGVGIPSDELPQLFDRFYQGQASVRRAHGGAGIGLALARELVGLHGGTLSASSEVGFGSAFTVFLPEEGAVADGPATLPGLPLLAELPGGDGAPPPLPSKEAVPRTGSRPRVLVVEDHEAMRAYLTYCLADAFAVELAHDGPDALRRARASPPDLVLSDVMMPGMDGYALCRALREDERLRDVPVVLLTARATREDALAGLDAGADDYVTKPFDAALLRARLAALVARGRALREHYGRRVTLEPAGIALRSEDEVFLDRVRAVLEARHGEATLGPEALAEDLGVSRRQLQRRLRRLTGQGPAALLWSFRLDRAVQLLDAGVGSVSEVAYRTGFRNASHFARAFREAFGEAPSAHRRRG
jgi:signal transduction histidine kinase/ligand-binding sensor domain-containing protein/DNA-binding response OmpR family regulator